MTTAALRAALRKRYAPPAWTILEEVRDATGHGATRSADAIAMSLWPSRGLELHGFEIKASRGDWLRELHAPEKAEPIAKYCNRWWIVAANESVVADGELPPAWGLLVLRGKALATLKEAPERAHLVGVDRPFLAALLRRATEATLTMTPNDEVDAIVAARVEATMKAQSIDPDRRHLETRDALLANLEEKTGVKVYGMNQIDALAKAYALIQATNGLEWKLGLMERAAEQAGAIQRELRAAVKKIREAEKSEPPKEGTAA